MMSSPTVCFHWRSDVTQTGLACQVVEIELLRPDRLMFPQDLPELRLPSELDPQKGVILTGRAPIWLYGWLVHACHYTRWVACYDPRLGAVVVSTHHPEVRLGEVLQLQSQGKRARLAAAVMVVGPPPQRQKSPEPCPVSGVVARVSWGVPATGALGWGRQLVPGNPGLPASSGAQTAVSGDRNTRVFSVSGAGHSQSPAAKTTGDCGCGG